MSKSYNNTSNVFEEEYSLYKKVKSIKADS